MTSTASAIGSRRWWRPASRNVLPVLVGVTPPRSANMLRFLHERIPGVEVDQRTFARMDGLDGLDAKQEGIRIAADVITAVRDIEGVAGVHIMAPGWEVEAVPQVDRARTTGQRSQPQLTVAAPMSGGVV